MENEGRPYLQYFNVSVDRVPCAGCAASQMIHDNSLVCPIAIFEANLGHKPTPRDTSQARELVTQDIPNNCPKGYQTLRGQDKDYC